MKKNTFKISNATIYIENQFIPFGKEYTRLGEIIKERTEAKGAFKMQFTTPYNINAKVLIVNFSKKNIKINLK